MFEGLIKSKKLDKAKELFTEAVSADRTWQKEAREDFAFRDGFQWTSNERRLLQDEMRPCLTFNLTKSSIDLIMGMNEDNRIEYKCGPVDRTDGFLCDVLNDLAYWLQQNNRFGDEEDDALESAATAGRGYVAIDFAPDPKRFGDIIMQEINVPVHEVHFDPSARKRDLSDASYIFWDRWLSVADFRVKYPKIKKKQIEDFIAGSAGSKDPWSAATPFDADAMNRDTRGVDYASDTTDYNTPLDSEFYDRSKNMIRVVQMEYWDVFKRNYVFYPKDKQWIEITGIPLKEAEAAFMEDFPGQQFMVETMMDKKVKWMQFTGDDILFEGDSPLPYPGFSICPTFVYADASKRTANHYGIVRLIKDPQREVNKRWSQALHLLNQQAQPGVYAETDAFVDVKQAEASLKEAGSITWVNPGAMNNKIKERTVPRFPDAPMQMEQFSQEIIKKITGINPDLLGQDRGRQEPGVVIRLRQQQGLVLLKPLFKSFNNMKRDLFMRQLAVIMEYMPDSQILRILGETDRYAIDPNTGIITDKMTERQANIREIKNIQYNVIAEESAGNMTKRMLELTALLEMQKGGFPVEPSQIIEKMSIPDQDKQRWMQYIQSQQESQAQAAQEQFQAQMQIEAGKLSAQDKATVLNFLAQITKVKQQQRKDDIKVAQTAATLNQQDRQMRAGLMTDILKLAKEYSSEQLAATQSEGEVNGGAQAEQ
jgi:hypothetical protein